MLYGGRYKLNKKITEKDALVKDLLWASFLFQ